MNNLLFFAEFMWLGRPDLRSGGSILVICWIFYQRSQQESCVPLSKPEKHPIISHPPSQYDSFSQLLSDKMKLYVIFHQKSFLDDTVTLIFLFSLK